MRKTMLPLAVFSLLVIFAGQASAQKDRFVGSFVNEDPNTRGITRMILNEDDTIRVWGRCHPSDCDWGEEKAYAYGSHVGADLKSAADAFTATYVKHFATKILMITPLGENRIRVDVFTRFTDRSRRTAFAQAYMLTREGISVQP